jgi:hypothetical protein
MAGLFFVTLSVAAGLEAISGTTGASVLGPDPCLCSPTSSSLASGLEAIAETTEGSAAVGASLTRLPQLAQKLAWDGAKVPHFVQYMIISDWQTRLA